MQKGYKRTGKAIAVLHFFIGLIVVAIFLVAGYFCLEKMDYSNRVNPDTTVRAYVEMTASPDDYGEDGSFDDYGDSGLDVVDDVVAANGPEGGDDGDVVDLLSPDSEPTPEPTIEATSTPIPTPIPTPSPTPTVTPEPTPQPTRISSDLLSKSRTKGINLPKASKKATAALTDLYVSAPNNNTFLQITGYAYIDDSKVNAANTKAFLIVKGKGRTIAYQAKRKSGASGVSHKDAKCKNPSKADFQVIMRVSNLKNGTYKLGVVLQYTKNRKESYTYYEFPDTFTVSKGAVSAVSLAALATTAPADAAAMASAAPANGAAAPAATDGANSLQGTAFGDGNPVSADDMAAIDTSDMAAIDTGDMANAVSNTAGDAIVDGAAVDGAAAGEAATDTSGAAASVG